MLHSEYAAQPVDLDLPEDRTLRGDAAFFRVLNERDGAELMLRQQSVRPFAATGIDDGGDPSFLRPNEWVFAPTKGALIAAVTRWDRIGICTRWYDWRNDTDASPSYEEFVREHQDRERRSLVDNFRTLQEAVDHLSYTPETFIGYWLIENLPNGMTMLDWFGPEHRHFIKQSASQREAECVMQEATFSYWRTSPPHGLRLLEVLRGSWR